MIEFAGSTAVWWLSLWATLAKFEALAVVFESGDTRVYEVSP